MLGRDFQHAQRVRGFHRAPQLGEQETLFGALLNLRSLKRRALAHAHQNRQKSVVVHGPVGFYSF